MTAPDVSVIVISYNDAARLPRAIESVRRQTLRNLEIIVVDDASTDGTEAVVRDLMLGDDRIRYERMASNSGGCSAPRNRGMGLARAPWIMFCDSDDEYERHACKNLLTMAEASGAQVVCGLAERVDAATGKSRPWRPDAHQEVRIAAGLAAFPELLYDTISVNKIYARDLLLSQSLTFPEGLLFEDQLFTLQAMASASVIASIPEVVYRWHVDRLTEEPSITQRRKEARNVADRVEINRRIDRYLSDHGMRDLKATKDVKFVRHDLYLYLSSILECDDQTARTLMDELSPYVREMDPAAFWQARTGIRLAAYYLLIDDLEGLRSAMRFVRWAAVVDAPVRSIDGREMWACDHPADAPPACGIAAQEWLDVTELGLLRIPFSQRRFLHRIESIEVQGEQVTFEGSTVDYDGSIAMADAIFVRLSAGGRTAAMLEGEWTGGSGTTRTWRARGSLTAAGQVKLRVGERGSVSVEARRGGVVNVTAARAVGERLTNLPCSGATLGLKPGANASIALTVDAVREHTRLTGRIKRAAVMASARLARPIKGGGGPVVFAMADGRQAAGQCLAVSRALNDRRPDVAQVWLFRSDPEIVPEWAQGVRLDSSRYLWVREFAAAFVSDGSLGDRVRAPRIDLGAGVPIHRIGLDAPDAALLPARAKAARSLHAGAAVLLSASSFAADVERRAFALTCDTDVIGLADMDSMFTASREEAKRALDLPMDRPVVVYSPLNRSAIDLDAWIESVGLGAYLVQAHGESRTAQRAFVRDIHDAEMSAAVAACDLFISDYSSTIGHAALADRPMILFQPDRVTFLRRTCGVYAGLEAVGPVVSDMASLLSEVTACLADPIEWDRRFVQDRRAFASDRCGPADGSSAQRAVATILRVGGLA